VASQERPHTPARETPHVGLPHPRVDDRTASDGCTAAGDWNVADGRAAATECAAKEGSEGRREVGASGGPVSELVETAGRQRLRWEVSTRERGIQPRVETLSSEQMAESLLVAAQGRPPLLTLTLALTLTLLQLRKAGRPC
jgi:hypothetical protein